MNKSIATYRNLAKLLVLTKKIEHLLEHQGGSGKGLWEKAKSIETNLYDGMLNEIFLIADVRNKAIHHSPQIDNIDEVISKAKKIVKKLWLLDLKIRFYAKTRLDGIMIYTSFLIKVSLYFIVLSAACTFLYKQGQIGGLFLCIPFAYLAFNFFENIQDKFFLYLLLLTLTLIYLFHLDMNESINFIFKYISSWFEYITQQTITARESSDL